MDEELGDGERAAPATPTAPLIVQFSLAALADLERVRDFRRVSDPNAASNAVAIILSDASNLADLPFRAPAIHKSGDRRLAVPFGRAGYLLDYRVDQERGTVTILRVRHSREAR